MLTSFFHILFYLLSLLFSRFQPFIQPFKECTLPQNTVLRFQYPMVFIGIDKQFGRHAAHDGCIKSGHSLVGENTEILFTVDAENRSVPFVYKEVRGVGKRTLFFSQYAPPISQLANHFSSVSRYCISILKMPSWAINALKRLS